MQHVADGGIEDGGPGKVFRTPVDGQDVSRRRRLPRSRRADPCRRDAGEGNCQEAGADSATHLERTASPPDGSDGSSDAKHVGLKFASSQVLARVSVCQTYVQIKHSASTAPTGDSCRFCIEATSDGLYR